MSLLMAVPSAQAPLSFNSPVLTPGQYTGTNIFVPGEVMTFTLIAGMGEIYDVAIVAGTNPLTWYYDQVIPSSGQLPLQYGIPATLPDGPYTIEVGGPAFDTNYPIGRLRTRVFIVQEYEFRIEVDRRAYLAGDRVTISWSANLLKDGSLADDGDVVPGGQIWVYNETWMYSFVTPSPFRFDPAAGTTFADLPPLADANFEGVVEGWFNSTTGTRAQYARADFLIERLSMIVDVAPGRFPNIYAPDGIVTTEVLTVATDNQAFPSPFDPPEPGVSTVVTVWDITLGVGREVLHPEYGASGLVTDARGELTYLFRLRGVPNNSIWEVRVNASHGFWTFTDQDSFTVSAAAGISVVLQTDQIEYQAGDDATMTASVTGAAGANLTYFFEVRDSTATPCPTGAPGTLRGSLTVTTVDTSAQYTYSIDPNFSGQLCFLVIADDGQGNTAPDWDEFDVVFGWLMVNADKLEYLPSDRITFSWELKSNRIQNPDYFYEVQDTQGNLVTSGEAPTIFVFVVPATPSPWYRVTVTASEAGRSVVGGPIFVAELTGAYITVTFDRASYARGDRMTIHYTIAARGTEPLPSTFSLAYGLENGATAILNTAQTAGDLTYVVPQGVDEGGQEFVIRETRTGASASEIVTIRGTNALWFVTLGDMPVLVVIMLLWLILMTLVLWRKGVIGGMGAPKAPKEPAAPSKMEPVYAPPTSPMTVTCRSCGSPIEITTSKRPIEVMCPKCGNTEMVA